MSSEVRAENGRLKLKMKVRQGVDYGRSIDEDLLRGMKKEDRRAGEKSRLKSTDQAKGKIENRWKSEWKLERKLPKRSKMKIRIRAGV